ncbi:SICA antigen [Plasmodium coatneyi]|uniref:SICA antigen n=1 Tax=Plasmodium coatneyi TaxID=208452 RepID=A0A1B1DZK6_9APIC|nr:SICA antigen [Plasmodium coatneyi]ANQ08055.1 SICA antigen [Plasmodium coatneyi]
MKGELEGKVEDLLAELKSYMEITDEKSPKIDKICGEIKNETGKDINQLKRICKSLVKVIYFMEGWDRSKNVWRGEQEKEKEEWKRYLKCVIGHTVILEMVEDKCGIKQVLSILSQTMQGTATNFPQGKENKMDCDWVQQSDITDTRQIMGKQIKEWLKSAKSNKGGVPGLGPIMEWMKCKGDQEAQEDSKQSGTCSNARIIDLLKLGRSKELRKLVNTDQPAPAPPSNPSAAQPGKEDIIDTGDGTGPTVNQDPEPAQPGQGIATGAGPTGITTDQTQNPGSSGSGSTGTWNPGSSGSDSSGIAATDNQNTGSPRPGSGYNGRHIYACYSINTNINNIITSSKRFKRKTR